MLVRRFPISPLLSLAAAVTASTAQADPPLLPTPYVPVFQDTSTLGSQVFTDDFTNLTLDNHPTYPTLESQSQAWPSPIMPDAASARQTVFQKAPGFEEDYSDFTGASGGGGIYAFFSNTHFEITTGMPVAGVATFELQLSMSEGSDDWAVLPGVTLTLFTTNGPFTLSPTASALLSQTAYTDAGFGNTVVNVDLQGYTWDVSAYQGTITGATIDWQADQHSIIFGAELAQAVPEPSSALLLLAGGASILFGRRCAHPRRD